MNTRLQATVALALMGLSAVAVTHRAEACGLSLVRGANGQWQIVPPATMSVSPATRMFLASAPASRTQPMPNPLQILEPIAGLYEVTLIAEGTPGIKNGSVVDHGYSVWHADGSEILNSGRPAGDTNFCLGTWAQTGKRSYTLNHYTLSWFQSVSPTPDPGVPPLPGLYSVINIFAGPGNISETITLAKDHQSFTGTFTITQYDRSGNVVPGFPVTGNAYGTRLTINSPPFAY
ncbi:MAG TPA: hypothetical protein VJ862_14025 [Rhodanobacteraceae bacterium]|nr:hypothetical protein [Rhodanobacteraceae bacterium]